MGRGLLRRKSKPSPKRNFHFNERAYGITKGIYFVHGLNLDDAFFSIPFFFNCVNLDFFLLFMGFVFRKKDLIIDQIVRLFVFFDTFCDVSKI